MKRVLIALVLSLLLVGCSSKDQQPAEQKDFERSYFVYQEGNSLILQFMDDNSKLHLTDKFHFEENMDYRITRSANEHLIFSDDHSKIIFPEYNSWGFASYFIIDLRSSSPEPKLIDSNIRTPDDNGSLKIIVNESFDEFLYIKSESASYGNLKLYKNDLKEVVVLLDSVDSDILISNSDLSRFLYSGSDYYLYVFDSKEGVKQLTTTSKPSSIISYSDDFETIIFRDGGYEDTYHYVMNGQEYEFPKNHLIYDHPMYAIITQNGNIVSISTEDSEYALKDVIKIDERNSDIEQRMASGEMMKLMYINIISSDEGPIARPIATLLLEPRYSGIYDSMVVVARPIDTSKLSNMKVNMSDLGVSRITGEIIGFEDFYKSADAYLYQLDHDFKSIKMEGFDLSDWEYTGIYVDWLIDGKEIISLSNRDSENNENKRFLNVYTLSKDATILKPEVITNTVCTYDLATYTGSGMNVNEGSYIYTKPVSGDCDNPTINAVYFDQKQLDETEQYGSISEVTDLYNDAGVLYLLYTQSKYGGGTLKFYTGDRSIVVSEAVEYYVTDRGKMVLYYINTSDDEYVDLDEVWYFDGSMNGKLLDSCKKLFSVYNAKVK
jgi:hypothetical protein